MLKARQWLTDVFNSAKSTCPIIISLHTARRFRNWRPSVVIDYIMSFLSRRVSESKQIMMTPSNGNIFRGTGHLCGEFTGPGDFPTQRPVTRSCDVFFHLLLNKGWVNNRKAGDLRRCRAHYDVTVMLWVLIHVPLKYASLVSTDLMMIIRQNNIFSQPSWGNWVNWKHTAPYIE